MKTPIFSALAAALLLAACSGAPQNDPAGSNGVAPAADGQVGQSNVKDETSAPNVVQIAVGSKDHTTLVTAVKAAGLVDALSNAGPFTVFAPVNAAFDKLPKGTVEDLLKPEKKDDLSNILGYHTYVGVLNGVVMQDGNNYDMVYGGKVKITKQGEKTFVNGSEILATIPASNGVIHVIGDVLLPPTGN